MDLEKEMRSYGSNSMPQGMKLEIEHRVDMLGWGTQAHYSFLHYSFIFDSGRGFVVRVYTDAGYIAHILDGVENDARIGVEQYRDWPEFPSLLKALFGFKFFEVKVGPGAEPLTDEDYGRYDLSAEAIVEWMPND